jgi:hypothetical protein
LSCARESSLTAGNGLAFLEDPHFRVPKLSDGLVAMRAVETIAAAAENDFSAVGA